jgi:hypothetical protein
MQVCRAADRARVEAMFGLTLAGRAGASMKTGFRAIGLLLAAATVGAAEMRTWTFQASGTTMQGEVVGLGRDAVTLKRADGKTVSVPIAYLTESDRAYLATERAHQWKEVEILKLEGAESSGRYRKCTVRGTAVHGEIYVEFLPASAESVLNNCSQQEAQIADLTRQIQGESQAVKDAKAALPPSGQGSRYYRRTVAAERAQVNRASKGVQGDQASLAKLQKSYDDYVQKTKEQATVNMRNTGALYKGLPVWECFDSRKAQ